MSREIRFRAWTGYAMVNNITIAGNGNVQYFEQIDLPPFCETKNVAWPVMQFTGLKDKNGVDIYEGDICKWPSGHLSQISWRADRACFTALGITQSKGVSRSGIVPTVIIVIGNIYEHPHLLTHA